MIKPELVIRQAIFQFIVLAMFVLVVPLFVAIDALVLAHSLSETSVTEVAQEALLFIATSLFGACAWRRPEARGFYVLVAGFFACMLIRELDQVFDLAAYHGFWVWPAAFVAVGSIVFARKQPGTVLAPMAEYVGTSSYSFLVVGLLVLILSRTFGSGNLLWKPIMGAAYDPLVKAAIQEGLELFGYVFICYGSLRAKPAACDLAAEAGESLATAGDVPETIAAESAP